MRSDTEGRARRRVWRLVALVSTAATVVAGVASDARAQAAVQSSATFSTTVTETTDLVQHVGTSRRVDTADMRVEQARTLDEALRLMPGVFVRTGTDGTPRIDVRGLRSRHVLLLVDGVPMNSTHDGQFDPSQIPTDALREISVSFGSSSVLYGEGAMAGAIEVVTQSPGTGLAGGFDVDVRQGDQRTGRVRLSGSRDRLSMLLTGSAFRTDGFRLPGSFRPTSVEDGGLRANAARTRNSLLAKVGYGLSDRWKLGGLVTVGRGAWGVPPSSIDDPDDPFAQRPRYERVESSDSATGQLSFGYNTSAPSSLRGWVYVTDQDEDRTRYDDDSYTSIDDQAVSGTFRRREETRITGAAVHGRYDLDAAGRLRLAVNARRESFATTGVVRDLAIGGGSGGGGGGGGGGRGGGQSETRRFDLRAFDASAQVNVYSTGVEWELRPRERTGVVLGYSQSWQQRSGRADAGGSWLLGVSQSLTNDLDLRASMTRKIRFPSIRQLYEEGSGNVTLEPERALGVDAGFDRRWGGRSSLSVSGFWMRVDDYIERDGPEDLFLNHDRYRLNGLETTLRTLAMPNVDLRVGYSLLNTRDVSPGAGRDELQHRPRHRTTVDARLELPAELTARAAAYVVADQVYYSRRGPLRREHLDNYVLIDLSLSKMLADRYELTAGVNNILDQVYEDGYALPRNGRTFLVTLGGQF